MQHFNTEYTLKDCLFGAAKLITKDDPDKYHYSKYDIGFDSRSLSFPNLDWGKNVVIFVVDNSSSVYLDNKKKIS